LLPPTCDSSPFWPCGTLARRTLEWKTTTAIDLLDWLTERDIAPGAYPGIGPDVFLDGAVHGADITVDEVGTEAAAATALGFASSGPPDPELSWPPSGHSST
jgi:hypothetical protein